MKHIFLLTNLNYWPVFLALKRVELKKSFHNNESLSCLGASDLKSNEIRDVLKKNLFKTVRLRSYSG